MPQPLAIDESRRWLRSGLAFLFAGELPPRFRKLLANLAYPPVAYLELADGIRRAVADPDHASGGTRASHGGRSSGETRGRRGANREKDKQQQFEP